MAAACITPIDIVVHPRADRVCNRCVDIFRMHRIRLAAPGAGNRVNDDVDGRAERPPMGNRPVEHLAVVPVGGQRKLSTSSTTIECMWEINLCVDDFRPVAVGRDRSAATPLAKHVWVLHTNWRQGNHSLERGGDCRAILLSDFG